jgi:hypothetical protein
MDYLFRAQAIHNRYFATKADYAEMRRLAETALQIDPQSNDALIWMAAADVSSVLGAVSDNRADQRSAARRSVIAPHSAGARCRSAQACASRP